MQWVMGCMPDDDNLSETSSRLGDRVSRMGDQNDEETADAPAPPSPETDDQPDYQPTTIYLPEAQRTELRRYLKRITLDFPEIEDAQKRELHTALITVAMEHPEEVVEVVD